MNRTKNNWNRNASALGNFFYPDEIKKLETARRAVRPGQGTIAYCTYENPFARSGGIYAVAENYSRVLRKQHPDVVLLSPFHTRLENAPKTTDLNKVTHCSVPFNSEIVETTLVEYVGNDNRWILFQADGFFEAEGGKNGSDPYAHQDKTALLRDGLFASAAIPCVLAALKRKSNVVVHVQDWQLATTALTVKLALLADRLTSAVVVLTSHNPYDHPLPEKALLSITDRHYKGVEPIHTVYQCMMPLTDAPVATVSRTFAEELTSDPLQTGHFADHLQDIFLNHGVIGIDNGLFGKRTPPFSEHATSESLAGNPRPILAEKRAKRKTMLRVLEDYQHPEIMGHLDGGEGRPLSDLPDDIPVFLMFGRLDPGQKGFDVFTNAIKNMLPGTARFVLTPIIVSETTKFREDLVELAETRNGDVVVYPFRMEKGYMETMAGATYAIMPSFYEPFGGATEPYLQGTPVLARATGGLVQQIVDITINQEHGTGILYKEKLDPSSHPGNDWNTLLAIQETADRLRVPLYGSMVTALNGALTMAGEIYCKEPKAYGRMLANGYKQALEFSWERAVEEYLAVYNLASQS